MGLQVGRFAGNVGLLGGFVGRWVCWWVNLLGLSGGFVG